MIDLMQIIIVVKIIDDIFSQARTDQSWQSHNQFGRKVLLDKLLKFSPVHSVRVQISHINTGQFVHTDWMLEYIYRADEYELPGFDCGQDVDQSLNTSPVFFWMLIGDPLLGRRTSTNHDIQIQASDVLNIRRTVCMGKLMLPL